MRDAISRLCSNTKITFSENRLPIENCVSEQNIYGERNQLIN